jgi:hypothetical protein
VSKTRCSGDRSAEQRALRSYGGDLTTFVQLSDLATPAYAQLVTEARQRMRRALIAARKARGP